jgi:phosphatidate phosphatase APP1
VLLPKKESRVFSSTITLVSPKSTIIVSDIDDTIKVSEVYKGEEILLQNTFAKPHVAASNMQTLLQTLQNQESNSTLHYLSGSPRQLQTSLEKFIHENHFSMASMHLKPLHISLSSFSFYNFFDSASTFTHKSATLKQMMLDFPTQSFILIGDSGEKDPEIYASFLESHAPQIKAIYIRNVSDENRTNTRMQNTFGIHIDKLTLIDP